MLQNAFTQYAYSMHFHTRFIAAYSWNNATIRITFEKCTIDDYSLCEDVFINDENVEYQIQI